MRGKHAQDQALSAVPWMKPLRRGRIARQFGDAAGGYGRGSGMFVADRNTTGGDALEDLSKNEMQQIASLARREMTIR